MFKLHAKILLGKKAQLKLFFNCHHNYAFAVVVASPLSKFEEKCLLPPKKKTKTNKKILILFPSLFSFKFTSKETVDVNDEEVCILHVMHLVYSCHSSDDCTRL